MAGLIYPTASDLGAFLDATGLTNADGTALSTALSSRLAIAIAASRDRFERDVHRVMLAASTTTTRSFNPPVSRTGALHIDDLAALTSVVYQPQGSEAQTLTVQVDYWIEPINAAAKLEPITRLIFRRRWLEPIWPSMQQSIQVTGKWGYATDLPAAAYEAMLARAALGLLGHIIPLVTGGMTAFTEADVKEDYGSTPLGCSVSLWKAVDADAVRQFRRWEI